MRVHPRAASLLPLLLLALLAPVRGAAGPVAEPRLACSPAPIRVTNFAKLGSEVEELAVVGSTLFFASRVPFGDTELLKAEQTNNTVVLTQLKSWDRSLILDRLIAADGVLYFFLNEGVRVSLWTSDGTSANTTQIAAFDNVITFEENDAAVMGRTLFFVASTSAAGFELWKSDGTAAGTQLVKDIQPGPLDSYPSQLTVVGNTLYFKADDGSSPGAHGIELWKSDGVPNGLGTQLVADILPGTGSSDPDSLTVMGGSKLFFTATSGGGKEIWTLDGAGLRIFASDAWLGNGHMPPQELTAVGDTLFFHMSNTEHGDELWKSDGTAGGTQIVRELQAGGGNASPEKLTAVGGTLFFMANDGLSGRELWKTDGTSAGTVLAKDFVDGSSNPPGGEELAVGPGVLLVAINDNRVGQELWKVNRAGAEQLTDIVAMGGSSNPTEMTLAGGMVFFAATYPAEGQELFALPLKQVDCLPPQVACPGNLRVEALSSRGASLFLPAPKLLSEDDSFTPLTVTYNPAQSSDPFPIGLTPVQITVSDAAGNPADCPVSVTVEDTTPPALVCPQRLVQEAAGPDGTSVFFPIKALDAVTASPPVNFSPPSGSVFQLGQEEEITATAMDALGNTGMCTFKVLVKDTVPPRISCPLPVVRVAMSADPVPISYPPPVVEDTVGVKEVRTDRVSGSLFNVGVTTVTLTAVDTSNNTSSCSFSVYNQDTVAPSITCPGPQQVVATSDEGAAVLFPDATAKDQFTPPAVTYSQEPGSTFPVGETMVTATARDIGGNEVSCTFPVTVLEQPGGCGCQSGSASASVFWLVLAMLPLWARRRAARLAR